MYAYEYDCSYFEDKILPRAVKPRCCNLKQKCFIRLAVIETYKLAEVQGIEATDESPAIEGLGDILAKGTGITDRAGLLTLIKDKYTSEETEA